MSERKWICPVCGTETVEDPRVRYHQDTCPCGQADFQEVSSFVVWDDNGSGYLEPGPDTVVVVAFSPEEALQKCGGRSWRRRVVTSSLGEDPNFGGEILAE